MTGAPDNDPPAGWDILAGEYVLGLLDADAARSVAQRARAEPALAAAIARWQNDLDPLADLAPAVPPSDLLWRRIEAGLHPPAQTAAPSPQSSPTPSPAPYPSPAAPQTHASQPSGNAWRGIAMASLALAAGLAAFIVWTATTRQTAAPWPRAVALLAAPGSPAASLRAQVTGAGTITVVPLRHLDAAPGRQLGFWAWPASEKTPVLLGMISPDGGQLRFPYPPREGTPVMVTSEPAGADSHNAPGPTLFLGLLVAGPG